jgi:hypothetical protein
VAFRAEGTLAGMEQSSCSFGTLVNPLVPFEDFLAEPRVSSHFARFLTQNNLFRPKIREVAAATNFGEIRREYKQN